MVSELLLPEPSIFLIEVYYDGYHGGGYAGFCLIREEAESKVAEYNEEAKENPCSHCGYVHTYLIHKVDKIVSRYV
jgi:hypothetical protein